MHFSTLVPLNDAFFSLHGGVVFKYLTRTTFLERMVLDAPLEGVVAWPLIPPSCVAKL